MRDTAEFTKTVPPFPLRTETLPVLFREACARNASRVAVKNRCTAAGEPLSYAELALLVSRLGAALIARGALAGARVGLLCENRATWGFVYAAVTSIGAAVVPLDPQLASKDVARLLSHAGSRILVVSEGLLADGLREAIPEGVQTVVIGDGARSGSRTTLDGLIAEGAALGAEGSRLFRERSDAVRPDDIAAICYTSGTTGQPKGVVLLHRNLVSNVEACRRRIPFVETDTFLSILPLHHTYATTCNLLAPLSTGSAIFYGRSLKSRDIRADIEREGVTVICGVPLLFERMAKGIQRGLAERSPLERFLVRAVSCTTLSLGRFGGTKIARALFRRRLAAGGLGSLRLCVSGAAALKEDVDRTFWSVGIPLLQGYGMTEASPVISVNPLRRSRRGTIGPPLPGIEARIDDPGPDGVGEIVVRGPNVMRGYLDNEEASAAVLENGWLRTGDLGRIGRDGYITFVGRKKSVIVTAGGRNVYADEIEAVLNGCWCILESIVLPTTDRKGNEQVGAIVVPDSEAIAEATGAPEHLTADRLRELVSAEVKRVCAALPEYKRIRELRVRREELPKTSTRKVKRHLVSWPGE
jgi:long-chain acyl-CoA synthetase